MGNVHMEASQINYRGGETKMSVEEAIKAGSSYELPIASAATLGGVKIGTGISIAEGGAISADAQLPSDPETDGTKVLTAITAEGTTTKSWAAPYTGFDYSTSEVNTGQKWIDGKDIFCKVYDNIQLTSNTDVTIDASFGSDKNVLWIAGAGKYASGNDTQYTSIGNYLSGNDMVVPKVVNGALIAVVKDNWSEWTCHVIIFYTKTAV